MRRDKVGARYTGIQKRRREREGREKRTYDKTGEGVREGEEKAEGRNTQKKKEDKAYNGERERRKREQ